MILIHMKTLIKESKKMKIIQRINNNKNKILIRKKMKKRNKLR